MVPVMLRRIGYVAQKGPAKERDTFRISFVIVPMLAALHNNGEAPDLAKIAEDPQQNSAVRLTCLLALVSAGEDLRTKAVLSILKDEKKLERRLVAVLVLGRGRDVRTVAPPLIQLLDDTNEQIRTAAVYALQSTAPREALPKLKRIVEENKPPDAVLTAIDLIGRIGTKEARQILASYLEKALDGDGRGNRLYYALGAFETATGQSWIEAGAHDNAYYQNKTREALRWWKLQK
jgi:HEAT repeat protein